jgi:single-stranded DNA-binding protein
MKLKTTIVGELAQHKLVQVEGKKPFLDLHVDVVLKSAAGKEYTQWVRVKVWHPLVEKIEPLLSKGCTVEVTGRPEVKPFSRRDGSAGAELIVHADTIRVVDDEETPEDDSE